MSIQSFTPSAISQAEEKRTARRESLVRRLNRNNAIASSLLWLITAIVALIFVAIIINIVWTGLPAVFSSTFYRSGGTGITSELFNSFYILILTEIFLFPISLAAAIFLV